MPPASLFKDLCKAAASAGIQLQKREQERAAQKQRGPKRRKCELAGAKEQDNKLPAQNPDGQKQKDMFPLLQSTAVALANERNWAGSAMLHHFVKPLAIEHTHVLQILRSGPTQVANLYRSYAKGSRNEQCLQIWATLADLQALAECGLVISLSTESHEVALHDDAEVLEQDAVASQVDAVAFQLVRQRCLASTQFTDTVQGILALATDPADQAECLQKLKTRFEVHQASLLQHAPIVQKWAQQSDCHRPVESRILQSCSEAEFIAMPAAALADAFDMYSGEVSTLIIENAFKELRHQETRQAPSPELAVA